MIGQQIRNLQGPGTKPANGKQRSIQGHRSDHRIHTTAVPQARIHHWRRFIHAASDPADNPLNDLQQVILVAEPDLRRLQHTAAFDEHRLVTVHQNVRDRGVEHQRFQRSQPKCFVDDLADQTFPFTLIQQVGPQAAQFLRRAACLQAELLLTHCADDGQIHARDQLAVDVPLDLTVSVIGSFFRLGNGIRAVGRHRCSCPDHDSFHLSLGRSTCVLRNRLHPAHNAGGCRRSHVFAVFARDAARGRGGVIDEASTLPLRLIAMALIRRVTVDQGLSSTTGIPLLLARLTDFGSSGT